MPYWFSSGSNATHCVRVRNTSIRISYQTIVKAQEAEKAIRPILWKSDWAHLICTFTQTSLPLPSFQSMSFSFQLCMTFYFCLFPSWPPWFKGDLRQSTIVSKSIPQENEPISLVQSLVKTLVAWLASSCGGRLIKMSMRKQVRVWVLFIEQVAIFLQNAFFIYNFYGTIICPQMESGLEPENTPKFLTENSEVW